MIEICNWEDIADRFSDTALLGNGASMCIDPCFSYGSLLEAARAEDRIDNSVEGVFRYSETEDFELVLNMLWHAHHINTALQTDENRTLEAYASIRDSLIATVRAHHTDYDTARPFLGPIWRFLKRFRTVVSLNYDLVVYWAMMAGNAELGNWFKDGFVDQVFDSDWKKLREPYRANGSTLVVNPHGNLFIASRLTDVEAKVVRSSSGELLESILQSWEDGKSKPLFVAEGSSKQKLAAIFRSYYLGIVFEEVLRTAGSSVAVYGWAAKQNDAHILRRPVEAGVQRFAFSLRTGGKTDDDLDSFCTDLRSRIHAYNGQVEVVFYRSDSQWCWVHA